MRKTVAVLIMVFLMVTAVWFLPVKAQPKTLIVSDDYQTVQSAIDSASEGETGYLHNL